MNNGVVWLLQGHLEQKVAFGHWFSSNQDYSLLSSEDVKEWKKKKESLDYNTRELATLQVRECCHMSHAVRLWSQALLSTKVQLLW